MAQQNNDNNNNTWQAKVWRLLVWMIALRKLQPIAHPLKISGDIVGQTFEHSLLDWCVQNGLPQYAVFPTELALKTVLYIILTKWILEVLIEAYRYLKTLLFGKKQSRKRSNHKRANKLAQSITGTQNAKDDEAEKENQESTNDDSNRPKAMSSEQNTTSVENLSA